MGMQELKKNMSLISEFSPICLHKWANLMLDSHSVISLIIIISFNSHFYVHRITSKYAYLEVPFSHIHIVPTGCLLINFDYTESISLQNKIK